MRDTNLRICPRCGKQYRRPPAISRKDNSTPICPECGINEALESIGIGKDERERIISSIYDAEDNK